MSQSHPFFMRPLAPLLGLVLVVGCGRQEPPSNHPGPFRMEAAALAPAPEGINRLLPDIEFVDIDGRAGRLSDYSNATALVIALRDADCPVSRQLGPTLARIEAACATQQVAFLFLNCATPNTAESIQEERQRYGFRGRYVHDEDGTFGSILGARTTAEVFLLDRARTLCYRGAVDDQFGVGYVRAKPQHNYLQDALAALVDHTIMPVKATSAPGCALSLEPPPTSTNTHITYYNQISRIVQEHCARCHHTGGVAPFALTNYEALARRRKMIKLVLERDIMPPWSATPGSGPWANDPSLSPAEENQVLAWIEAGAPPGSPADAPVEREFPDGWTIGTPDVIVEMTEAKEIEAQGVMPAFHTVLDLPFKEDVWIQAVQILPSSVKHVHHALALMESTAPPTLTQRLRNRFKRVLPPSVPSFQTYFAVYVPGSYGQFVFPPGTAAFIPAGTRLHLQTHYVTTGIPGKDRTRIGFVLAKQPPAYEVRMSTASSIDFVIPAGAPNHPVEGEYKFRQAGKLVSLLPHMHYRGKAFQFELVAKSGATTNLLSVPAYNFNWQHQYVLHAAIDVQPGMRLRATGWYDNSTNNPANPDPTADVTFGIQSTNEMMTGCFAWVIPVTAKRIGD